MTTRKPPGTSWERWVDRQVREARERGDFDDLPGKGKPLAGLDQPHDELWWVKQWMRREAIGVTPPTLALRRDLELVRDAIANMSVEADVRRVVEELNARIREVNRKATSGPPSTLWPLDVERVVADWNERRRAACGPVTPAPASPAPATPTAPPAPATPAAAVRRRRAAPGWVEHLRDRRRATDAD